MTATSSSSGFESELAREGERTVLVLRGSVAVGQTGELHRLLDAQQQSRSLVVDVTGLTRLDGAGAALIATHTERLRRTGAEAEVRGASEAVGRQLSLYSCDEETTCRKPAPTYENAFDQVGRAMAGVGMELVEVLSFVGEVARASVAAVRRPRSVPWDDLPSLMNRAGADGLPIVVLINFLVGFTIALSGAGILSRYGANVFVAELVGFSVLRELAPLMTAIVVAGRSGASYAAELGTMEVGEEVDALRTMSLEPVRYLVLPRTLALILVVPLLTVVADVIAIAGGALVAITSLDLTLTTFLGRLRESLDLGDVMFGLIKSAVFAAAIALVACRRGLGTRGGAAGVGASTTSAVVVSLFLLVGINAVFAGVWEMFGW